MSGRYHARLPILSRKIINRSKTTVLAGGGALILAVAMVLSSFVNNEVFAQTAQGTCTVEHLRLGDVIFCTGTVTGLQQGILQGPIGQCPTGPGQSVQAQCRVLAVEQLGTVFVSVPITVTRTCTDPSSGEIVQTLTDTTTRTVQSAVVSAGSIVQNPGGHTVSTIPGVTNFDVSISGIQPLVCPQGLNPGPQETQIGTAVFRVECAVGC